MFLAGDIGGTKTNLAFFDLESTDQKPVDQKTFKSKDYATLVELIEEFLAGTDVKAERGCLSIAGPVRNGRCKTPNLPWDIDQDVLERKIGFEQIELINDLHANAHGIFVLREDDFVVLNEGDKQAKGNAAVISAGTGLGEAGLYWDGQHHHPFPSEGGHANFGPTDDLQAELLKYMQNLKGAHISYERVLSGPGLYNIYQFLRDKRPKEETTEFAEELQKSDPGALISKAGIEGKNKLCVDALNMFVTIYGSEAGNVALKFMAVGGVFLGGGIAPKILVKLREPLFMEAFLNKGRMKSLLEAVPVKVITNDQTALLGAAKVGREMFSRIKSVTR